jgi:hypothetical protein
MDIRIRSFNAWRAERMGYNPSVVERMILLRSPLHSHTEIQFSTRYDSISFSATTADKGACCRFKPIMYTHPEYWDTLIIPTTDAEEDLVYAEAKKIEGQPYDVIGLMSFASRADIIHPQAGHWWCTEAVLHCLLIVKRLFGHEWFRPDQAFPTLLHVMYSLKFQTETIPCKEAA